MSEEMKKQFKKIEELSGNLNSLITGNMGQMVLNMIDKLDLSYATEEQKKKFKEIRNVIEENK